MPAKGLTKYDYNGAADIKTYIDDKEDDDDQCA
jgi:hypothetical protein